MPVNLNHFGPFEILQRVPKTSRNGIIRPVEKAWGLKQWLEDGRWGVIETGMLVSELCVIFKVKSKMISSPYSNSKTKHEHLRALK